MFERAIEIDADYAPAWAGLATVHAQLYEWFGAQRPGSRRSRARQPDRDGTGAGARGCARRARLHDVAAPPVRPGARTLRGGRAHQSAISSTPTTTSDAPSFARGEIERSAELFGKAAAVRQEDFQSPSAGAVAAHERARGGVARDQSREHPARRTHPGAESARQPDVVAGLRRAATRTASSIAPSNGRSARSRSIPTT